MKIQKNLILHSTLWPPWADHSLLLLHLVLPLQEQMIPTLLQNKYKNKFILIGHAGQIRVKHYCSNIWKYKYLPFKFVLNFPQSVPPNPYYFRKAESVVSESGGFYFCTITKMPFNLSNDMLQISLADEWNQVSCHSCQLQGWDNQINL